MVEQQTKRVQVRVKSCKLKLQLQFVVLIYWLRELRNKPLLPPFSEALKKSIPQVKIMTTVYRYPTALVTILFFCLATILVSTFPARAEEFIDATAEYDPQNIFAKILRGEAPAEIVFENDYALAFHDIAPRNKVHVLVIPKGPYANFMHFNADASDAEKLGLLDAISQTAIIMGVNESGFRLLSNTGQHGKQTVPHLHVHLRGGESVH